MEHIHPFLIGQQRIPFIARNHLVCQNAYGQLAQCYGLSAASCGGFAGQATFWAAYDTMSKAVELLPSDSEYLEHAKSALSTFRNNFPSSEECFFNELQSGARYTVTCGTAAGVTTTVRPR